MPQSGRYECIVSYIVITCLLRRAVNELMAPSLSIKIRVIHTSEGDTQFGSFSDTIKRVGMKRHTITMHNEAQWLRWHCWKTWRMEDFGESEFSETSKIYWPVMMSGLWAGSDFQELFPWISVMCWAQLYREAPAETKTCQSHFKSWQPSDFWQPALVKGNWLTGQGSLSQTLAVLCQTC